jgi:hypothetical protein
LAGFIPTEIVPQSEFSDRSERKTRRHRQNQKQKTFGEDPFARSLLLERSGADRCDAVSETFWYVRVAVSLENEKARPKDLNELANLLRGV